MKQGQQLQIYRCLGNLLDYPTFNLAEQTRQYIDLLKTDYPDSSAQMASFLTFVESKPLGPLEEVYTGTFDINPACHIFAGHLLFGESFKRGAFMAKLEEEYQKHDFDKGKELADHVPVLFKFLAELPPNEPFVNELISDCLIPVFKKMNSNFKDKSSNPYLPVVRSASVVLEGAVG